MEAASFGHVAVVEALIQHAATKEKNALTLTSAADKDGWTALHDAAYRGHVAVIDALLGPAVEWGRGTTLLSANLACDEAAGGLSHGSRCTAEQLARQHGEAEVIQAVGGLRAACSTTTFVTVHYDRFQMARWRKELERNRAKMAALRHAETVASLQRLALATTMEKMGAQPSCKHITASTNSMLGSQSCQSSLEHRGGTTLPLNGGQQLLSWLWLLIECRLLRSLPLCSDAVLLAGRQDR